MVQKEGKEMKLKDFSFFLTVISKMVAFRQLVSVVCVPNKVYRTKFQTYHG